MSGPLHILGQSLGGSVVMEYLEHHPSGRLKPLEEVVLFAPLIRPYAWGINRWVFALARRTIAERTRVITNNAENPEFLDLQRKDPLQDMVLPIRWVQALVDWMYPFELGHVSDRSVRIIQGHADRTVAWKHNLSVLARRFPNGDVLHIPPARHHLVNESPAIRDEMWRWLHAECRWGG
jgi:alpha-beta hydrolase superfamily lysophospholipase